MSAPPPSARQVVPLELKTGRPSFSAEHQGQVTLYSMMTSERRPDPGSGLLLYLRSVAAACTSRAGTDRAVVQTMWTTSCRCLVVYIADYVDDLMWMVWLCTEV